MLNGHELVGIGGSRGYSAPETVRQWVRNRKTSTGEPWILVSGGCPDSPDVWAVGEARKLSIPYLVFPADWSLGKSAGFARNTTIADVCDQLIAFWDGNSRGTRDTMAKAHAQGKPVWVIRPDGLATQWPWSSFSSEP